MELIQTAFEQITRELGQFDQAPSISTLTLLVMARRGKLLRFDRYPLHSGVTGLCVSLADCDLIRICADADPILADWSTIHELCHLYLDHVPRQGFPIGYEAFKTLSDQQIHDLVQNTDSYLEHSAFTSPYEQMAETLATLIVAFIENHIHKTSIFRLYGQE